MEGDFYNVLHLLAAEISAVLAFLVFTHRSACRPRYLGDILYSQGLPWIRTGFLAITFLVCHQLTYAAWGIRFLGLQGNLVALDAIVECGKACCVAGLLVYTLARNTMGVRVLPPMSVAPTEEAELVTAGIYACSRNPMYLSYLLTFTGAQLVACSPLILAAPLLFLTLEGWIKEEELDQHKLDPERFLAYVARTPRWLSLQSLANLLPRN